MTDYRYINGDGKLVCGNASLLHHFSTVGSFELYMKTQIEAHIEAFMSSPEGLECAMLLADAAEKRNAIQVEKFG